VLTWYIREGKYGDIRLDGLNLVAVAAFEGNIWDGGTKVTMALLLDERTNDRQRQALQMVFGGQAGGWPGYFSEMIGVPWGLSSLA
jgi:hypothetical protein